MRQFLLLFFFLFNISLINAQNCFQTFMDAGKKAFEALDFENAINQFEAAKVCDDKPRNNDVDQWIANSQTGYIDAILNERIRAQSLALTAKSILELQKNDNASLAFRYAQYALQLDDNPDSRSAFYDCFYQLGERTRKNFYVRDILHFEGASNRFTSADFIDQGQCFFVDAKNDDIITIYDFDGYRIGEIPFEGMKYSRHAYCEKTGLLLGTEEIDDEHFVYAYTLKNKQLSDQPVFKYKTPYNETSGLSFIFDVAVSKNGKFVVASLRDGSIHVLNGNGDFLYEIPSTNDGVAGSFAFSDDDCLLTIYDRLVKVIKLSPSRYDVLYKHEEKGMYDLNADISQDHSLLSIAGGRRGRLMTIDGDSIAHSKTLGFFDTGNFSKDGRYSSLENRIWDLKDRRIAQEFDEEIKAMRISPDSRYVLGLRRGKAPLLYRDDGNPFLDFGTLGGHSKYVLQANFSPDSTHLLTASMDGSVKIWNPALRSETSIYGEGEMHHTYSFESRQAMTVSKGNSLYVFNTKGEITNRYTLPVENILALSSDGKYLFGNNKNGIELWSMDLQTGKFDFSFGITNTDEAHLVSFSNDDKVAIYKSSNSMLSLQVWDFINQKSALLKGYRDELIELRFSPDNKRVGGLTRFGKLYLWNIEKGPDHIVLEHSFEPHPGAGCPTFEFSKDGQFIATSSNDYLAAIWNLKAEKQASLRGHSFYITTLDFSPDGQYLMTGSDDGTARIWDMDGNTVAELKNGQPIRGVRFSQDGSYIMTKEIGQTIVIRPFDPDHIINYLESFGIPDLSEKEKIKYGIPINDK